MRVRFVTAGGGGGGEREGARSMISPFFFLLLRGIFFRPFCVFGVVGGRDIDLALVRGGHPSRSKRKFATHSLCSIHGALTLRELGTRTQLSEILTMPLTGPIDRNTGRFKVVGSEKNNN